MRLDFLSIVQKKPQLGLSMRPLSLNLEEKEEQLPIIGKPSFIFGRFLPFFIVSFWLNEQIKIS